MIPGLARCRVVALALALSVPAARAELPTPVQVEVNFLLGYVEGSSCEFYRNGSWHDSKTAQAHLRHKYEYLVARKLISTTEDFIERGATESSLSGQPYLVKCNGNTVTSSQWLRDELVRYRTFR